MFTEITERGSQRPFQQKDFQAFQEDSASGGGSIKFRFKALIPWNNFRTWKLGPSFILSMAPQRPQKPSVTLFCMQASIRGPCGDSSVTAAALSAVPGSSTTSSAQLGTPQLPLNPSVCSTRLPQTTAHAQSFTLFNQNETLSTITAFQGTHTYMSPAHTFSNISTCRISPSLLPSHYPLV